MRIVKISDRHINLDRVAYVEYESYKDDELSTLVYFGNAEVALFLEGDDATKMRLWMQQLEYKPDV